MPDLAWLFLITTSGCVLQGDRLALDVTLGAGARAHVTTQSATKVHAMDANYALADAVDRARRRRLPRVPARPAAPASPRAVRERDAHHRRADRDAPLLGDRAARAQAPPSGRELRRHPAVASRSTPRVPTGGCCSAKGSWSSRPASPVRQTGVMDCVRRFRQRHPADAEGRTPTGSASGSPRRSISSGGVASGACRLPNEAGLIYKVLGRETAQVKAQVRAFWEIVRREVVGATVPAILPLAVNDASWSPQRLCAFDKIGEGGDEGAL